MNYCNRGSHSRYRGEGCSVIVNRQVQALRITAEISTLRIVFKP